MRHDPHQYDYEPEEEVGWCKECGKECVITNADNGIGPYEFHGQKGRHVDIQAVSSCCEGDFFEYDPSEDEE